MGLLIESVVWNGLVIDRDFKIWQTKEEVISILGMPYQDLKKQVHMAATRAVDWDFVGRAWLYKWIVGKLPDINSASILGHGHH